MDLKTKRKQEIDEQKEKRKEEVVLAAVEVFKEKGIENAKMTDVADKAQVGVASVYRYFKTKLDLAIDAATMLWKEEINELYSSYSNEDFIKLRGLERVKSILEVFLYLYKNQQDFLTFIHEFDNYIVREQVSGDKLINYEKSIIDLKTVMLEAMKAGKTDGSILREVNGNEFYNTITHTLMSLCQKLLLRGRILKSDEEVEGEVQIKLIIDMAVRYLENK